MKCEFLPPAEPFALPAGFAETGHRVGKTIEIVNAFFLRGPSIWTYRPAIEAWIDIGELEDFPSNLIPGFPERLSSWLPGLIEHRCGIGERGGFLMRLRDGTWPAHILEHVMIELQQMANIETGFGKAREASRRGVYKLVVRTPDEEIGRLVLHQARDLVMAAIEDRPFDVPAAVATLRALAAAREEAKEVSALLAAANRRRIPVVASGHSGLIHLGQGANQRRVWKGEIAGCGAIAQGIANDRKLRKGLFDASGVPVPEAQYVDSAEEAWEAAQDIGLPVVVKPREGVLPAAPVALHTQEQVAAAFEAAYEIDSWVMVERFVTGKLYRLLVIGKRVAAAALLESSSAEQAACACAGCASGMGNGEAHYVDVTASVHPDVAAAATLAARVVGLEIAGVTVVAESISRPLDVQAGAVIGIESQPRVHLHTDASGNSEQAADAIMTHLFGEEGQGRIPVIGITGSRGRATVSATLERILRADGQRVGVAGDADLRVNGRELAAGKQGGWEAAQRLLRNPHVDTAIIENDAHTILSTGLGYDRCAVGIVTQLDDTDILPEYDIRNATQMANVLRTQVDVVLSNGVAVLNATDPHVSALAPLCDGEVIFYASDAQTAALAAHRQNGGRAVFLHGTQLVFAHGATSIGVALSDSVSALSDLDGLLAAAAAAWALGVSHDIICSALGATDERDAHRMHDAGLRLARRVSVPPAQRHHGTHAVLHASKARKFIHGSFTDQSTTRTQSLEQVYGY